MKIHIRPFDKTGGRSLLALALLAALLVSSAVYVASATAKLFDLASASCTGTPSTNPKGVITLPATVSNPFSIEFQQAFANGICVLTSGATNITVIYD